MALVSTQSLTEMNTRNISSRVQVDVLGLTTLPPSYAGCIETLEPQTPGILRVCPGLYSDFFRFDILYEQIFNSVCRSIPNRLDR
jgi:hypothetical protein